MKKIVLIYVCLAAATISFAGKEFDRKIRDQYRLEIQRDHNNEVQRLIPVYCQKCCRKARVVGQEDVAQEMAKFMWGESWQDGINYPYKRIQPNNQLSPLMQSLVWLEAKSQFQATISSQPEKAGQSVIWLLEQACWQDLGVDSDREEDSVPVEDSNEELRKKELLEISKKVAKKIVKFVTKRFGLSREEKNAFKDSLDILLKAHLNSYLNQSESMSDLDINGLINSMGPLANIDLSQRPLFQVNADEIDKQIQDEFNRDSSSDSE